MQHVSAEGRRDITTREGRRLVAYRDSRGIWTIGVGHTGRMSGVPVYAGMTITEAQCDALLAADLAPVEATIARVVTVPLSQNEFDALASLGFNIGIGGLARSTVVKRLNLGGIDGAANAFMDWCKPASLTSRRLAEREQFLRPNASSPGPVRAAVLAHKADVAQTKSARKAGQAAGTGVVGAAIGGGAAIAQHGHAALWIAAIVVLGAAIDGVVSLVQASTAKTLTANAGRQVVPPPLIPAPIAAIPQPPVAAVPIPKA